jgi:hypothetical protein
VLLTDENGTGSADQGPLSPFIQRMRQDGHDTRPARESVLRPDGSDASEANPDRPIPNSNRERKRKGQRTTGKGYRSQRRHRRPRNKHPLATVHSGWDQSTQSTKSYSAARHHGRHDSKKNKALPKRTWTAPTLKCVHCGGDVTFTNENRCEDCFAIDQEFWHGRPSRAKLEKPSEEDSPQPQPRDKT